MYILQRLIFYNSYLLKIFNHKTALESIKVQHLNNLQIKFPTCSNMHLNLINFSFIWLNFDSIRASELQTISQLHRKWELKNVVIVKQQFSAAIVNCKLTGYRIFCFNLSVTNMEVEHTQRTQRENDWFSQEMSRCVQKRPVSPQLYTKLTLVHIKQWKPLE